MEVQIIRPAPPAGFRYKLLRDYSGGSLRERIRRAESGEELAEVLRAVVYLAKEGRIPLGSQKKLHRAMLVKKEELLARKIIRPPKPKLVLP